MALHSVTFLWTLISSILSLAISLLFWSHLTIFRSSNVLKKLRYDQRHRNITGCMNPTDCIFSVLVAMNLSSILKLCYCFCNNKSQSHNYSKCPIITDRLFLEFSCPFSDHMITNSLKFVVFKETVLLRRGENEKRKFGFRAVFKSLSKVITWLWSLR